MIADSAPPDVPQRVCHCLRSWLATRLSASASQWLEAQLPAVAAGDNQTFALSFGLAPRKVGKADLLLSPAELEAADQARTGWDPRCWSVDQAVRCWLLLTLPVTDQTSYVARLDRLCAAADVGELIAVYQSLALLPFPAAHRLRAAEGIRTSMRSVFCAVAHYNPYPAEQLEEDRWNQMVLKCLFIGVPLAPVVGIDARANAPLMQMLVDYAHERWAAKRTISPELWRVVGPYADANSVQDLARVLREGTELEQQAAALALAACPQPAAAAVLAQAEPLRTQIAAGQLSWQTVAANLPSA